MENVNNNIFNGFDWDAFNALNWDKMIVGTPVAPGPESTTETSANTTMNPEVNNG